MRRKIASVCMALALMLALLPLRAAAADDTSLVQVNGSVTLYEKGQLTGNTYAGIQYNPATSTLTLTNFTGTKIQATGLPALVIELVGNNTVNAGELAVGLDRPTIFRGTGTLTMGPAAGAKLPLAAIASSSDVTLESGHFRVLTNDASILGGVAAVGNLTVGPDASVDIVTTGLPGDPIFGAIAPGGGALACGGKLDVQGMRTILQGATPAALAPGATLTTTTDSSPAAAMLLSMGGQMGPGAITISAPCVTIAKAATITALTASPAELPAQGGAATFTLTGKNLPEGVTLAAYENGAPTGLGAAASGTGDAVSGAIAFPANSTQTAKTYTVRATLPGQAELGSPSATVTVAAKTTRVESLSLNMNSKVLRRGKKIQLRATILPKAAAGEAITWKSSNTRVATVTNKGLVKAVRNGAATITARVDGKLVRCRIVVRADAAKKAVRSVKLDKSRLTLRRRQKQTLKATLNPQKPYNRKLVWTTSNPKVAKVNKDGRITAVGKGTCKITVRSFEGGKTAVCTVRVR